MFSIKFKSCVNFGTPLLISKINRTNVKDVRIRRGAKIYSEHYLLRVRIRMDSRRKRKMYPL